MKRKIFQFICVAVLVQALLNTPLSAQIASNNQPGLVYRQAVITDVKGTVETRTKPKADWQIAKTGDTLYEGNEIRTGAKSRAVILLKGQDNKTERADLILRSNSQMSFKDLAVNKATNNESTHLNLAIGKVMVKAKELKGDSDFDVQTPTSVVGVWGTQFEVSVKKKDS